MRAAINKTITARIIRFRESWSISQNLSVPTSCFIIAIDMIPPARAAMKYAPISGIPCSIKRNRAKGRLLKLDCVNIPIAAAMTLAFQAKTKIAPAPKIRENTRVKIKT